jgi:hypothetical protein
MLARSASPNSVGWIATHGRRFPGLLPILGSRSTTETCQRCGVTVPARQSRRRKRLCRWKSRRTVRLWEATILAA